MSGIYRFGAIRVGGRPIKTGLLYEDERGKVATVVRNSLGVVELHWMASGKRSRCEEPSFRRRFSLYGNGHGGRHNY